MNFDVNILSRNRHCKCRFISQMIGIFVGLFQTKVDRFLTTDRQCMASAFLASRDCFVFQTFILFQSQTSERESIEPLSCSLQGGGKESSESGYTFQLTSKGTDLSSVLGSVGKCRCVGLFLSAAWCPTGSKNQLQSL